MTNTFRELEQHVEVHGDHRIVDPMLQNTTREDVQTKTLRKIGKCV